jgi:hypothetical protein
MSNLNRMSMIFVLGPKIDPEDDVRTFSFALRSHKPNAPDILDDWDDGLREAVEDNWLSAVWPVLQSRMAAYHRLVRIRWHEIGERRDEGYPVLRERELDSQASGGISAIPQAAMTVTLEVPARKRWGRIYLPGMPSVSSTTLRPTTADVDALANAHKTFFDNIYDLTGILTEVRGAYPVVVQRATLSDGLPGVEYSRVSGVRVDNVPDVIRSRRFRRATYRKINELANPG